MSTRPGRCSAQLTDKEVEWDGQTAANIDFNKLEPAFDEADVDAAATTRRTGATARRRRHSWTSSWS